MITGNSSNTVTITMQVDDKATPEFKRVVKQAGQATNSIEEGFRKASASLRDFRRMTFFASAAIGVIISTVQQAAKYNREASTTFEEFKKATTSLAVGLGVGLEPALKDITTAVRNLDMILSAATAGFIKLQTLAVELATNSSWNPLKAADDWKNALDAANKATDDFIAKNLELKERIASGFTLENEDKSKNAAINSMIDQIEAIANVEKAEKSRTKTVEQQTKARTALAKAEVTTQIAALDAVAEMTTLFGKESKAAFYILKAIKAAEIIVNSAAADMNIMAVWAWNPAVSTALIAKNKALTIISLATVAAAAIAGSFAKGTSSVPSDMLANIHKGETIIPATFAESIRSGKLSLSGPGGGSFGDINIFIQGGINAAGASINEMAEQLGFAFEREVRTARGF